MTAVLPEEHPDTQTAPASSAATTPPPDAFDPRALLHPQFWRDRWIATTFWVSTAVVTVVFFLGAWERRWIADDGLIVLRTVRNLLAGNGPVFNAGERVEANTSTLWTYLIYGVQRIVQPPQVEVTALWVALVCSMLAIVFASWGARVMWVGTVRHPSPRFHPMTATTLMLPFGTLIYVVLPPARDFATSGLETGLVICWIATVWLLLQRWARAEHHQHVAGIPTVGTAFLAFVAGLGPLVRPEMALVSAAVLALIFFARSSALHRLWLVVIAGSLPIVYQIWRMGYYGLPYPNTAVAKDAGGAKWDQGLRYLADLNSPYWLALPVLVAVAVVGLAAVWIFTAAPRGARAIAPARGARAVLEQRMPWLRRVPELRSTVVVTTLFVLCGVVLTLYTVRVGGDFMHGRVLLPPLFTLLLPLAVLPIPLVAGAGRGRQHRIVTPVIAVGWLAVAVWAVTISFTQDPFPEQPERISRSGIVEERIFYLQRTGHKHPLLARDYLDFPRMRTLIEEVRNNKTGAVFLPIGGVQDRWDVIEQDHPLPGLQPFETPDDPQHTVVFLNLGMTSMNLPLDVKVYDTVGLATPLAAHTDRMVDGRIGHDKYLPADWFVADAGVVSNPHNYPYWIDPDWVEQAKVALTCPATVELRKSYADPLTPERRAENLRNAFSYAQYRINRIPAYEVQRCGMPMPLEVDLDAFPR